MKKILFSALLLVSMILSAQETQTTSQGIFVTGEGKVNVVPDKVVIKSQIEHEGVNAYEVKNQNDETTDAVIKFLKTEGIAEKNIQTDYVNLNKRYNYNDKSYTYVASQAISITLEDLENYEKIISGLLNNGLNGINGIQFKSSDVELYKTEARKKAILDAKRKAKEFAEPLGQEVGKAISINENSGNNFQPVYRMAEMMKASDPAESNQETIAPGELEISVKVDVGFQLH